MQPAVLTTKELVRLFHSLAGPAQSLLFLAGCLWLQVMLMLLRQRNEEEEEEEGREGGTKHRLSITF